MKQVSTIKLIDLIKGLQEVLDSEGNIPVVMSRDEEGNGFNTLSADDFVNDCVSIDQGICILYPWAERMELDEIKGAKKSVTFDDFADSEEEDDENSEEDELDDEDPPYGCMFNDDE